jgi:endonuclease/exonuclease/phosphatase (EEP) superfamily protein YafD
LARVLHERKQLDGGVRESGVQWIGVAAAGIVILWTALPFLRHEAWWIRIFDFPRRQIAVLTLVTIPAYVALAGYDGALDRLVIGLLCACALYQLVRIGAYTPLFAKQAKNAAAGAPERRLGIVVANVLTTNRNATALLEIVRARDPDVMLFMETDAWWQAQLDALEATHPHTVKCPQDNLYGMHLYSRLELVEPKLRFLLEPDIPSIHAGLRLRSGECVEMHCVHPRPPAPTEASTSVERDAELLVVAKAVASAGQPAIVIGDLNDVAWSATTRLFQKISGMLDPRVGRGMFSTFHAQHVWLRWPLDHIFISPEFTVVSLRRLGYFGSDHFPIHAELAYSPPAASVQQAPQADADDEEVAEEKIREAATGRSSARARSHAGREPRGSLGAVTRSARREASSLCGSTICPELRQAAVTAGASCRAPPRLDGLAARSADMLDPIHSCS